MTHTHLLLVTNNTEESCQKNCNTSLLFLIVLLFILFNHPALLFLLRSFSFSLPHAVKTPSHLFSHPPSIWFSLPPFFWSSRPPSGPSLPPFNLPSIWLYLPPTLCFLLSSLPNFILPCRPQPIFYSFFLNLVLSFLFIL